MTDQATESPQPSPPVGVSSSEGLGPLPELAAICARHCREGLWQPNILQNEQGVRLNAAMLLEQCAAEIERLEHEASFYRRRCEALQAWQSRMRDPERTVVCDILANGFTLDQPFARDRYELKAERWS